jgi:hypothetical protein
MANINIKISIKMIPTKNQSATGNNLRSSALENCAAIRYRKINTSFSL